MGDIEQRVNNFFDGLTRQEFINLLEDAGFEVFDGNGRILNNEGKDITNEIMKNI